MSLVGVGHPQPWDDATPVGSAACRDGTAGTEGCCPRAHAALLPTHSGRVAKEVMESSAKIKREPPEIHR